MKKKISHSWKVFLILSGIFFVLLTFLFIDPYSPLSFLSPLQDLLFSNRLGQILFAFFVPGIHLAAVVVDTLFEPIVCPFFHGCPGRYDGSSVDTYFFFPLQGLVVSVMYAGILTGIVAGIRWLRRGRRV